MAAIFDYTVTIVRADWPDDVDTHTAPSLGAALAFIDGYLGRVRWDLVPDGLPFTVTLSREEIGTQDSFELADTLFGSES